MKKYVNHAFYYALVALTLGVFYREFTKFFGFHGKTTLSVLHTHYFILGMFFFLIVLILEKLFTVSTQKQEKWFFITYNLGLNLTGLMFLTRGILQVTTETLPRAVDASISGIAGIGHALLGLGIIFYFIALRKKVIK